jgi:hypothetical protein
MCEPGQINEEVCSMVIGRLAQERGWLFMAGCLTGDTIVATTSGIRTLKDLCNLISPVDLDLATPGGVGKASLSWRNYASPTIRVETASGFSVEGTLDHKVMVGSYKIGRNAGSRKTVRQWKQEWKELSKISKRDYLIVKLGANVWGNNTTKDAYLLGLYTAEGSIGGSGYAIGISTPDSDAFLIEQDFRKSGGSWWKSSKELVDRYLLCGRGASNKVVHPEILASNKNSVINYLQGLFDGDGWISGRRVAIEVTSEKLARQVHFILGNLGIQASIHSRQRTEALLPGGRRCVPLKTWTVSCHAYDFKIIGFRIARKQDKLNKILPVGNKGRAERAGDILFDQIKTIQEGFDQTFDLHVPLENAYLANNIIVHNTLEDDANHPRWAWYEERAADWLKHSPGDSERGFSLPSWTNLKVFPGGREDPEILYQKQKLGDYSFKRRIAAEPVGVEDPCFEKLWSPDAETRLFVDLDAILSKGIKIVDGAIGVDYGTHAQHPSAAVVIKRDSTGRYWIAEGWQEATGSSDVIDSVVTGMKKRHNVHKVCTDPLQEVLAQKLGGVSASKSGTTPTEIRIGNVNGLINDDLVLYDKNGKDTKGIFRSMRKMRRLKNARGQKVYSRDIGDDLAQAAMYAFEILHIAPLQLPDFSSLTSIKFSYDKQVNRAGMVGRV